MRGYESLAIGLALLLVPGLAWMVGRQTGRRDASVSVVIVLALVVALLAQAIAIAASVGLESLVGGVAGEPLARRLAYWASAPEFAVFLLIFGVFVGMVGWSSVPASRSSLS
jgi:hypothetical protein